MPKNHLSAQSNLYPIKYNYKLLFPYFPKFPVLSRLSAIMQIFAFEIKPPHFIR